MILVMTAERSGTRLDKISLVNGSLVYETGAAKGVVEGLRRADRKLTDRELFRLFSDWSNGYVTIKAAV